MIKNARLLPLLRKYQSISTLETFHAPSRTMTQPLLSISTRLSDYHSPTASNLSLTAITTNQRPHRHPSCAPQLHPRRRQGSRVLTTHDIRNGTTLEQISCIWRLLEPFHFCLMHRDPHSAMQAHVMLSVAPLSAQVRQDIAIREIASDMGGRLLELNV